jgi:hypothetical protein
MVTLRFTELLAGGVNVFQGKNATTAPLRTTSITAPVSAVAVTRMKLCVFCWITAGYAFEDPQVEFGKFVETDENVTPTTIPAEENGRN